MKLLLAYSVLAAPAHRPLFFQNDNLDVGVTKFNPNHRLISTAPGKQEWMTEQQIFKLYRSKTKFIDLTDGEYTLFNQKKRNPVYPTKTNEAQSVNDLIKQVSTDRMETFLSSFSGFHTRYYNSKSGKESSQWLYDQLSDISGRSDVTLTVTKFEHSWEQFSVIARFEKVGNTNDEIVILSAHQDSVNQWNPCGADDDGSGTTTIIEALTVLYENGFVPDRPLEFHFYSGEEGGLLGSQKVVKKYTDDDINVYAVLHNDMTGYQPDGISPVIGISTDNVDKKLSKVLQIISEEYAGIKWVNTKCGYACSDHASWTKAGVPAAFTFEAAFENQSPFLHTTQDTVEHIDFNHMASFVNNVIGFAVELSKFQQ
ncbi:Leucine aminopeptidase 1 [Terramyces sp. JEL0728]|nr:Leucine aminopeptidase 1 [Terramyces sp. JEL0728]